MNLLPLSILFVLNKVDFLEFIYDKCKFSYYRHLHGCLSAFWGEKIYKTINVKADEDESMSIYLTTLGYFINYTENLNPNGYG